MLDALSATLLVFVAVGLMLYLITLLFNAASLPLGSLLERQRFARYVARARRCDALLAQGDTDGALAVLRQAFYLHPVRHYELAGTVTNHHTALLSRLIAITAEVQGGTVRLLSLAKTDRLLAERAELQKRYFRALQSGAGERVAEALTLLASNAAEVDATLQHLMAEVRAVRQPARPH